MNWDRPILTDSGGFQIFSLADTLKLSDDGVEFRSILDGSKHFWTPEDNMRIQEDLGADIVDAARRVPAVSGRRRRSSPRRSSRSADWAARCKAAHTPRRPGALRHRAGRRLRGPAPRERRPARGARPSRLRHRRLLGRRAARPHARVARARHAALPADKPRYLMGVGNPDDDAPGHRARRGHVRLRACRRAPRGWGPRSPRRGA